MDPSLQISPFCFVKWSPVYHVICKTIETLFLKVNNNSFLPVKKTGLVLNGRISNTAVSTIASLQTSFGVRLSRIHFSPTDIWSMGEKWIRHKWTPKDICGEAISTIELKIDYSSGVENKLLFKPPHTLSTVKWLVPYHKKFLPLIMVGLFPQDNIPVPVPVPES